MSGELGVGVAFPVRLAPDGQLALSVDGDNVRESIRVLLSTDPGERLMRPGYGGGLRSLLFAPNTTATHRLMTERIRAAIDRWEPRVAVRDVTVVADAADPHRAVATIAYQLVATGEPGTARIVIEGG
jgi:uncharacterized protein